MTDLGTGSATDGSLRRCVIATRLARAVGCDDDTVREVVYVSLLQHLGCTAGAHELAQSLGDDIAVTRLSLVMDETDPRDLIRVWAPGLAAATHRSRTAVLATTLRHLRSVGAVAQPATCEVAREAARRLGLAEPVQQSLAATNALWNGTGFPRLTKDEIPLPARMMHVASVAELFHHMAGTQAARAEVARRTGTHLDPAIADVFRTRTDDLLDGISDVDPFDIVLGGEPDPVRWVDDVVDVARTFGDLVDLKSPRLQGHSAAVAELAVAAAARIGLQDDLETVRVAGHLHDVGRAAVNSRIWSKTGPLTAAERDQTRLHPYHSERVLARVPELREAARLAGQHHERCDGSGYHRGLTGAQISMPSRVLAAADAYRQLIDGGAAAPQATDGLPGRLRGAARSGALDGDAVEAVLDAAGHRSSTRATRPHGLTARQVEVLRLVSSGLSNREIADRLVISRRTAEHHVQDVYLRIGVSTRAAAALYAMENGLLPRR